MRFGDESQAIGEWVTSKLGADAALAALLGLHGHEVSRDRIWDSVAPEGTPAPWIVFQVGDWADVGVIGPDPRLMVSATLSVKAIDQAESYTRIQPIARRLVAVLHGTHNAAVSNGGLILTCLRQHGVQYPETGAGQPYRHLGAVYEVITQ